MKKPNRKKKIRIEMFCFFVVMVVVCCVLLCEKRALISVGLAGVLLEGLC